MKQIEMKISNLLEFAFLYYIKIFYQQTQIIINTPYCNHFEILRVQWVNWLICKHFLNHKQGGKLYTKTVNHNVFQFEIWLLFSFCVVVWVELDSGRIDLARIYTSMSSVPSYLLFSLKLSRNCCTAALGGIRD